MRATCLFCASKHVAQAIVLMLEAEQGYPIHRWLAVGHLAEAGDETIAEFPDLSRAIRKERLFLMGQTFDESGERHDPNALMNLLKEVRRVAELDGQDSDEEFLRTLVANENSDN